MKTIVTLVIVSIMDKVDVDDGLKETANLGRGIRDIWRGTRLDPNKPRCVQTTFPRNSLSITIPSRGGNSAFLFRPITPRTRPKSFTTPKTYALASIMFPANCAAPTLLHTN